MYVLTRPKIKGYLYEAVSGFTMTLPVKTNQAVEWFHTFSNQTCRNLSCHLVCPFDEILSPVHALVILLGDTAFAE